MATRDHFAERVSLSRLAIIFTLLFVPSALSLIASPWSNAGAGATLRIIIWFLAAIPILILAKNSTTRPFIGSVFLFSSTFWAFDGLIQWWLGSDLFGFSILRGVSAAWSKPEGDIDFGAWISLAAPVAVGIVRRKRAGFAVLLASATIFVVALTGIRSNLLILLLGLSVAFYPLSKRALIFATFTLALGFLLSPGLQDRISTMYSALISEDQSVFQMMNEVLSNRGFVWAAALEMARDNPITGVGLRAFGEAHANYAIPGDPWVMREAAGGEYMSPGHAHNLYLGALAETGVVGLLGWLTAAFLPVVWWKKSTPQARELSRPYLAGWLVVVWPFQSSPPPFEFLWFPYVAFVLVGLLGGLVEQPKKEHFESI